MRCTSRLPALWYRFAMAWLALLCIQPAWAADDAASLSLIPLPMQLQRLPGSFELQDGAAISVQADAPEAREIALYLAALVSRTRGLHLHVAGKADAQPAPISFELSRGTQQTLDDEAYRLQIDARGVRINAATAAGLFYGSVTLWQLLTPDAARPTSATLPLLTISDSPRFAWRGLMLDSARHFQSVADIEQLIDWMALHKLNVLQWHLTDDQGWRLEIKAYPKLTAIGGCRKAVGPDAALSGGPDKPYCGFYTQAQAREIVAYAASRFVTVVPEIEIPGHAQAAIATYPEFGVTGLRPSVSTDWGIHPYLYNVDAPTLRFLDEVLDEVMAIFPSTYIDVGGDEALKDQWIASPAVQARMHSLKISNEDALQSWLIAQVGSHLHAHGRKLIGWDDMLAPGLPAEAAIMSWHGPDKTLQALGEGRDVVLAYSPTLYLDNLQSDAHDEPPGRPPVVRLKDVYDLSLPTAGSPATQKGRVLGAQINLWSEYMPTFARDQHAIFPRIAALADIAWSPAPGHDWDGFLARLPAELARYRALGIRYADSAFQPRFALAPLGDGRMQVTLSTQTGVGLRYTTDGREPTPASPLYAGPLDLTPPLRLSVASFAADGSLLAARARLVDSAALATRDSDALSTCAEKLVLRIEDDRPLTGPRPVYRVDIMDTCWLWRSAQLDGIRQLSVRVGNMPWNYQLAHDVTGVVVRPMDGPYPALDVYRDGCQGPRIARLSLQAAAATELQTTLKSALPVTSGDHDLCFIIDGDPKQGLWAIDEVRLSP